MTTAREGAVTTQELEQTRDAWDSIAAGYDEFVTHTEVLLANEEAQELDLRRRPVHDHQHAPPGLGDARHLAECARQVRKEHDAEL